MKTYSVCRIAVFAACICFLMFMRALSCDFVNWDDTDFVLNNQFIRSLNADMIVNAFTNISLYHWVPLLWISFAVDYHFWGLNPVGYHLTNILLHAVNTGLVVLIADGLFRRYCTESESLPLVGYLYPAMLLLSGLLFGIHPARVESVAWVTERKDVLNGLFIFASIYFYLRHQQKQEEPGIPLISWDYLLSLILFLLSLMAKPSSALIPVAMLFVDWYPLGRIKKGRILPVLVEKVPFLVLAAVILVTSTFLKTREGAFNPLNEFPFGIRAVVSGNAIAEYFRIMVYPAGILPYYDLPRSIPQVFVVKALGVVGLVFGVLFLGRRRPWVPVTVLTFIVIIFPSLQFFADGAQLICASRYTYLPALFPSIILSAITVMMIPRLSGLWPRTGIFVAAGAILTVLGMYTAVTQSQIGVWKDSGTMWSRVIASRPFDRAYFYRGLFYVDERKYDAAVDDYSKCIEISIGKKMPDIYNLYAFRGEALVKAGRNEEAIRDFDAALTMFPHKLYYFYRAAALRNLGLIREAEADLLKAGRAKGQMYWFPLGSPL